MVSVTKSSIVKQVVIHITTSPELLAVQDRYLLALVLGYPESLPSKLALAESHPSISTSALDRDALLLEGIITLSLASDAGLISAPPFAPSVSAGIALGKKSNQIRISVSMRINFKPECQKFVMATFILKNKNELQDTKQDTIH